MDNDLIKYSDTQEHYSTLESKYKTDDIEITKQKNIIQTILNADKNISIVTDFKNISFCNSAFLDFFEHENVEAFNQKFDYPLDIFQKLGEYNNKELLSNVNLEDNFEVGEAFFDLVNSLEDKNRVAVMLNSSLEAKSFILNISHINNEQGLYLITFTDVLQMSIEEDTNAKVYIDNLTGIANRNSLEEAFDNELSRATRDENPLSVAVLDIDRFNNLNEKFGRSVGDEVLVMIANEIKEQVRQHDIFARWGADEFILLFPNTYHDDAVVVANKLRELIESLKHETAGKTTCSFGLTQFKITDDLPSLLKRCSDALEKAKDSGRNRVESN